MRARRILFLNNQGLDQSGGGVTLLRHLAAHFARENSVIVLAESRLPETPAGIDQRVLPRPAAARGPLWRLQALRKARHYTRAAPGLVPAVDLVIALDCHFAGAVARLRSSGRVYISLSAIPRMEWFLAGRAGGAWSFAQYVLLERRMIAWADTCLVSSALQAREIRRYELLPRFDPVVLPPTLPALEPSILSGPAILSGASAPTIAGMAPEQVVILSVARLEALKGLELVPELARRLADLPCVFLILGEGPQRPVLEQRVRALGLEQRVRLLGDVRDPSPYFRRADVYLHPSRYESFGMALFEAMQHGVAPLCGAPTRRTVVATPEFLEDRREGRLVDLDDPEAVAQALREWIERPEERRAVGRAAAERARRFLAADYAERVERLAQALLDEGGRPR